MLSMVRTSAKRRRPQRPEFADTTVWEVAHFERRLSTGHANVVITSLRKCTRGAVIVINYPLNLGDAALTEDAAHDPSSTRHAGAADGFGGPRDRASRGYGPRDADEVRRRRRLQNKQWLARNCR